MLSTKKYNCCFLLDVLPSSEVMLYFHLSPSKEWVSLVLVLPGVLFCYPWYFLRDVKSYVHSHWACDSLIIWKKIYFSWLCICKVTAIIPSVKFPHLLHYSVTHHVANSPISFSCPISVEEAGLSLALWTFHKWEATKQSQIYIRELFGAQYKDIYICKLDEFATEITNSKLEIPTPFFQGCFWGGRDAAAMSENI